MFSRRQPAETPAPLFLRQDLERLEQNLVLCSGITQAEPLEFYGRHGGRPLL
jgi:hypothetical protein